MENELKQLAESLAQRAATVLARSEMRPEASLTRAAEEGMAAGFSLASQVIADRYYVLFGERLSAGEPLSTDNPETRVLSA